ncbi:MAG TPA: GTPase Era [Acidimicrobiales bacterium]|nr:GTPase Era [Acidimicrobiales bacterium]
MRSGFVTFVGRPNVGKSTLVNQIVGSKVTITSDKPQTTRHQIRGVLHRPESQIVLVDTPGVTRPRSALGERLAQSADEALSGVDLVVLVIDATARIGAGDRAIAARVAGAKERALLVLNKVDLAKPEQIIAQLSAASQWDLAAYFPVSAVTGEGVDVLVEEMESRMPEGPAFYPDDQVRDLPDEFWVAELVREQLLAETHDELPHSIACRVTEWEWPRIRCEIVVERDSQKGIVIGKGGGVLRKVGEAARAQLPPGAFLELHVTVEKDWQRRPDRVRRMGY